MTDSLNDYTAAIPNWRQTLARNQLRTKIVILLFFVIYLGLGLLIDLYLYAGQYRNAPLSQIFHALITFKLTPIATIIMFIVASISLWVSFVFYDKLMLLGTEYQEITEKSESPQAKQLYNIVEEMRLAAGLKFAPKIFIIHANYMNAFASGYSEKSAMIAITQGLLTKLNRAELQAVIAHELSHIRHLDIKLTLTASLLTNLTLMVLDIFFYQALYGRGESENDRSRNSLTGIILLLRFLLPIINLLLILYLSRTREYMADAGAVQLTRDNTPLANALLKIQGDHETNIDTYQRDYRNTPHENVRREAYIFDPLSAGIKPATSISDWFSTHPSIQKRLTAIGFKNRE